MKIYEYLEAVNNYILERDISNLEEREEEYHKILYRVKKFKIINNKTKILEVGTGLGWFPILCNKNGISCSGIEISPQLVNYSLDLGKRFGINPNIIVGNIENVNLDISKFDVIIATSLFEHVKLWKRGIKIIYNALKPEGLFYFISTNKFAFKSGEFNLPFYGWFPNKIRYAIRKMYDKEVMKFGIDFNQFSYFNLRRFFKNVGFSQVIDIWDLVDINNLNDLINFNLTGLLKRTILKIGKRSKLMKKIFSIFIHATIFICIK